MKFNLLPVKYCTLDLKTKDKLTRIKCPPFNHSLIRAEDLAGRNLGIDRKLSIALSLGNL